MAGAVRCVLACGLLRLLVLPLCMPREALGTRRQVLAHNSWRE
jgi:hypothetical protein